MATPTSVPPPVAQDNQDFEILVAEISAALINADVQSLDDLLVAALQRIVQFIGVDRSTLGRFATEQGQLMPTHSWAREGLAPLPSPMFENQFPYCARQLRNNQPLVLPNLDALPDSAATDRASLQRVGLQSLATFPLHAQGTVIGWLSFGTMGAAVAWPPELLQRLRLISEIFASALLRQRNDLELCQALTENEALRAQLQAENALWREEFQRRTQQELVGHSPAFQRLMLDVERVASTDSTVLLLGETGTGKELLATAIHQRSRRADQPLVCVNCAALPATLIESELFGHEKGAFTGALAARPGRFELADGGTLVLDEIGELPLDLQSRLLRVLQSGEFERLGSSRSRRVDVRLIASTNRHLAAMTESGDFRSDLYYRLSVYPIHVPPLRERKEDIPLLAAWFVDKLRARLGRTVSYIPDAAIASLSAYDWPGNIRELENIIERSLITSANGELTICGIPMDSRPDFARRITDQLQVGASASKTLSEIECDYIRTVCESCSWRINGRGNAADKLGINPNTLRSRMKKLGIKRPPGVSA